MRITDLLDAEVFHWMLLLGDKTCDPGCCGGTYDQSGKINDEAAYKAGYAREEIEYYRIGEGIAIPHVNVDTVDKPGQPWSFRVELILIPWTEACYTVVFDRCA